MITWSILKNSCKVQKHNMIDTMESLLFVKCGDISVMNRQGMAVIKSDITGCHKLNQNDLLILKTFSH